MLKELYIVIVSLLLSYDEKLIFKLKQISSILTEKYVCDRKQTPVDFTNNDLYGYKAVRIETISNVKLVSSKNMT